jgi:CRP-like cAMP-binding protein
MDIQQGLIALKESIQQRTGISDEELLLLAPYIEIKNLPKKALLTALGEVEQYVYYIVEGITRSYFKKDTREISFEFYFTGTFINSYTSFLTRKPSAHAIEAFTPVVLLCIHHDDLMELYAKSSKFEQIGRIFTEDLFHKTSERVKDLISLSAQERYQKLLDAYPQYIRQIPLKYLASFLNMTPESLSRIRKNI